jgi:hypothetical protein
MSGSNAQPAEASIRKSWPASIDKSHLPCPEPRRIRDRDHVRFVAKQPCLICAAGQLILIICVLCSTARSAAKSAMSSLCRCAAAIIVRSVALATKPHGGQVLALIRLLLPVRFGWRPIRCRQVPTTWAAKSRARRPLSALIRRTSSVVGRSPTQARIALGRKVSDEFQCPCVAAIIERFTGVVMKWRGGKSWASIRPFRLVSCGWKVIHYRQ